MATLVKVGRMNDIQVQNWLRKVGQANAARLAVAMLGADEDIQKLIYKNMSPRAGGLLRENFDKNRGLSIDEKTITASGKDLEKLI